MQISLAQNLKRIDQYVSSLEARIPESQSAMIEARQNNEMPSLTVDGEDFIALLELPSMGAILPIGASWNPTKCYPCRYDGSVYDGSLMIGGTNRKGQFDFVKELAVGSTIRITDMTGNRFSYVVSDIRYAAHADTASLTRYEDDLTVFIKNLYAFEYIILYCTAE